MVLMHLYIYEREKKIIFYDFRLHQNNSVLWFSWASGLLTASFFGLNDDTHTWRKIYKAEKEKSCYTKLYKEHLK